MSRSFRSGLWGSSEMGGTLLLAIPSCGTSASYVNQDASRKSHLWAGCCRRLEVMKFFLKISNSACEHGTTRRNNTSMVQTELCVSPSRSVTITCS